MSAQGSEDVGPDFFRAHDLLVSIHIWFDRVDFKADAKAGFCGRIALEFLVLPVPLEGGSPQALHLPGRFRCVLQAGGP